MQLSVSQVQATSPRGTNQYDWSLPTGGTAIGVNPALSAVGAYALLGDVPSTLINAANARVLIQPPHPVDNILIACAGHHGTAIAGKAATWALWGIRQMRGNGNTNFVGARMATFTFSGGTPTVITPPTLCALKDVPATGEFGYADALAIVTDNTEDDSGRIAGDVVGGQAVLRLDGRGETMYYLEAPAGTFAKVWPMVTWM